MVTIYETIKTRNNLKIKGSVEKLKKIGRMGDWIKEQLVEY